MLVLCCVVLQGCQNLVWPSNVNIDYAAKHYCHESIDTLFIKIRSSIREIRINKGVLALFLLFLGCVVFCFCCVVLLCFGEVPKNGLTWVNAG